MALPTRVQHGYVDPVESAQRDFNAMLNRFFGGQADGSRLAPYAVDVREDADHLYVIAELPGFRKEDVDITLENQTLVISARRSDEKDESKGDLLLHERRYNQFARSFTLPPTVDEKSVDARLESGVLRITLNKREESKPRKIAVS